MSLNVCLAPANTIGRLNAGGHFWVYLHWALGLRALGCRVLWLEGIDSTEPSEDIRRHVVGLRDHLRNWNLGESLALYAFDGTPLTQDIGEPYISLDSAADADLLLNLWYSLPEVVVRRFRRSVFVDTDPGLLQMWMAGGFINVARHDTYFTIGETVGTPGAGFPDCDREWLYTPPPVFLPAWPVIPPIDNAPYTTVTHWWGMSFLFNGVIVRTEKRSAFLEYLDLPSRTSVPLELAVRLGDDLQEYRQLMEPRGWTIREALDVSATPQDYRAYIQRSRGEFSCAKAPCVDFQNAWVSDRTLCYLASGRPAVVQHTGPSRILPDADGLIRFRDIDEAARALETAEAEYERHCRQARALVEEYFDSQRVIARVMEKVVGS